MTYDDAVSLVFKILSSHSRTGEEYSIAYYKDRFGISSDGCATFGSELVQCTTKIPPGPYCSDWRTRLGFAKKLLKKAMSA